MCKCRWWNGQSCVSERPVLRICRVADGVPFDKCLNPWISSWFLHCWDLEAPPEWPLIQSAHWHGIQLEVWQCQISSECYPFRYRWLRPGQCPISKGCCSFFHQGFEGITEVEQIRDVPLGIWGICRQISIGWIPKGTFDKSDICKPRPIRQIRSGV
jgi:hypothetical protein